MSISLRAVCLLHLARLGQIRALRPRCIRRASPEYLDWTQPLAALGTADASKRESGALQGQPVTSRCRGPKTSGEVDGHVRIRSLTPPSVSRLMCYACPAYMQASAEASTTQQLIDNQDCGRKLGLLRMPHEQSIHHGLEKAERSPPPPRNVPS